MGRVTVDGAARRPRAGDVVGGCRLVRSIGSGGAADVWLGVDRLTGGRMAVKVYRDGDPPAGERLRVRHPHVVAVRRIVDDPPAVVLDLAEGGSVAALVGARGPLDVGEVATVLVALGRALADLHDRGLVHGDVSAANVLLAGDGRPLLADLADLRIAGSGPVAASAGFAAPEVLAGEQPGPAADIHGLCAVAWFALSGAVPDPAPPRLPLPLLVPAVPGALAAVLVAGLDPDPPGRPTPGELVAEVMSAARCEPVRLIAGALPAVPPAEAVTHRVRRSAESEPESADGSLDGTPGAASGHRRGRARPPTRISGRRGPRLVAVAAAGVVTGAGLAAAGAVDRLWGTAAAEPRVTATALPTVPPATGGPAAGDRPSTSPGVHEVGAVVADLVAQRERFLRGEESAALDLVYLPGTAAGAADAALAAEHGPLDISLEVEGVTLRPRSADSGLVVDVTLATRPAGASGAAVQATTDVVRLRLAPADGAPGWRIAEVAAPS